MAGLLRPPVVATPEPAFRMATQRRAGPMTATTDDGAPAPDEIQIEPTGRKIPHPWSCGGCHGVGCPEVRLTGASARALREYVHGPAVASRVAVPDVAADQPTDD